MKNRGLRKAWGVLFLVVMACIAAGVLLSARGGLAQEPTTVRIGSGSGDVGDNVTVRLDILDVPDPGLGVFNIDIDYDPAILEPVNLDPVGDEDCVPNPNDVEDLAVLCNIYQDNDNAGLDVVTVGGFTSALGIVGDVALADITFEVIGAGVSGLTLNVVELTDTNAANIPHGVVNGSITGGEGPGGVVVAIDPPEKKAYIADGQFTVDIVVNDVDNLGQFEFVVDFDPAVIAFVSFAEGPFLSSTGRTVICLPYDLGPGSKQYGCSSGGAEAGPDGSGVLATISFSPIAVGTSAVDLHDVGLYDATPDVNPIPAAAQDGQVTVATVYGDVSGDCDVDIQDVGLVFAHWPSPPLPYDPKYDMNGDGKINIQDVGLVFAQWPKPDMCP